MEILMNEAVIPVIDSSHVDVERIKALVSIKEMIDRLTAADYLHPDEINSLERKYGAKPTVCTWGDYFQAELATQFSGSSDKDFYRAIDTVRFDIISSIMIFSNKDQTFMNWVDAQFQEVKGARGDDTSKMTEDEKEIYHLKILMDYYTSMQLKDALSDADTKWFTMYSEARAV